jgi:excisionase family DNA binding protein
LCGFCGAITNPPDHAAHEKDNDVTEPIHPIRRNEQPRVLLTVEQAAAALAIGRTNVFKLIKTKEIASVRVGQLRRIPASEIDAYVARLIAEQNAA